MDRELETTSKYSGKSMIACIGALLATEPGRRKFKS